MIYQFLFRYCFTRTSTECDEQTKKIEREVCTYTYATKRESLKATTVKVGSRLRGYPFAQNLNGCVDPYACKTYMYRSI